MLSCMYALSQNIDTLTIGQSGNCDFKTVSSALNSLCSNGINKNTVLLLSSYYDPADSLYPESFPIIFNTVPGASDNAVLSLVIADNVQVSWTDSLLYVVGFINAKYVEIYGNQRLTITNNSVADSSSAVAFLSDVSNVIVDGCIISAGTNQSETFGIKCGSQDSDKFFIPLADNVTLSNNVISRAKYGIYFYNVADENNLIISGNSVGDVRGNYMISKCGIDISTDCKLVLNDNHVFGIMSNNDSLGIGGMYLHCRKPSKIFNNLVVDVVNNSSYVDTVTNLFTAVGVVIQSEDSLLFYNNMISHVASESVCGMMFSPSLNSVSQLYYNSIYLCPDYSSGSYGKYFRCCFMLRDNLSGNVKLVNNIFQNSFGNIYSIYDRYGSAILLSTDDVSAFVNNCFVSDHNFYYTSDITNGYACSTIDSINIIHNYSIDEWNAFNGNDTTCKNKNPDFTSVSLLKIGTVNAAGIPLKNIVDVDYFGNNRNDSAPDIGAHELQVNTGIINYHDNLKFNAYYSNDKIIVSSDESLRGNVYVFDMSGHVVGYIYLSGCYAEIPFNGKSGVYLVSYYGNKRGSDKIFVGR